MAANNTKEEYDKLVDQLMRVLTDAAPYVHEMNLIDLLNNMTKAMIAILINLIQRSAPQ